MSKLCTDTTAQGAALKEAGQQVPAKHQLSQPGALKCTWGSSRCCRGTRTPGTPLTAETGAHYNKQAPTNNTTHQYMQALAWRTPPAAKCSELHVIMTAGRHTHTLLPCEHTCKLRKAAMHLIVQQCCCTPYPATMPAAELVLLLLHVNISCPSLPAALVS